MVPPYCGCGWAKTTAARIAPFARPLATRPSASTPPVAGGSSSKASRLPTGPGMSRSMVLPAQREHELADDRSKTVGPRHASDMSGLLQRHAARGWNQLRVGRRGVWRHDVVETGIAAHDQRGRRYAGGLACEVD